MKLKFRQMKKYILILSIFIMLFSGCVKDEMPKPAPPAPVVYDNIMINELISKDLSNPYYVDGMGDGCDWVEIFNNGNEAVDLAGMWITDKPGTVDEYQQIPETDATITTIPPKGFIVLICGAKNADDTDVETGIYDGKIFINMGLSSSKDTTVAIYDPERALVDISDNFSGLEDDRSFGRVVDASDDWNTLIKKTPGAPNDGEEPTEGELIVNEFMASNDIIPVPGDNGDFPDWIEIYNTGDTPINMGGWFVSDAMDDIQQYQLPIDNPQLTTVPGHGFLILYCDGTGDGLHTNFKLSSGGEEIVLSEDGENITIGYSYCDTGCDLDNPPTNFSAGRNGDGEATWVIFDPETSTPPTPGASNGVQ